MKRKVKAKASATRIIRSTSKRAKLVEPSWAAARIGAEVSESEHPSVGSATALHALGRGLSASLRSSGGRPGLEGTERRQKVPLSNADWSALELLAGELQASGVTASAGQVAGQLLHEGIHRLRQPESNRAEATQTKLSVSDVSEPHWERALEPGKTYLIGAGINRSVRGWRGIQRAFPLAKDFFQYVLDHPQFSPDGARHTRLAELWQFIERHWHRKLPSLRSDPFDLEECMTLLQLRLDDAQDDADWFWHARVQNQLVGLLGECLGYARGAHHDSTELSALGHCIREERASVLTFNYDTLLEDAVQAASPRVGGVTSDTARREWNPLLAYKTHFDELVTKPGIPEFERAESYYASQREAEAKHAPFLKLHGSLGWYLRSGHRWSDGRRTTPARRGGRGSSVFFRDAFSRFDMPQLDQATAEVLFPLVITPVLNKPVSEGPFKQLWSKARDVLRQTRSLVVAGYSFPPTDFHVRRLFREAFAESSPQRVCVVNPDTSVVELVRDLCHFAGPVVVYRDLAEFAARARTETVAR